MPGPLPKRSATGTLNVRLPVFLFALVLLIQIPVPFSHENYLLTWFNIDDGYYYFVTARNIAAGQGVTFDGVSATNGFHPLWMFLITPLFLLPAEILPLRVLAGVLITLNAGAAVLVCRLTGRRLAPWPAFLSGLAFALLPPIHDYTARGGMEAGLSAFLMVLLLYLAASPADPGRLRPALVAGFTAALAFLARLDNVFLAVFAGLALIWRQRRGAHGEAGRLRLIRPAAAYFLPLVLTIGAYMLWSQIGFGTPTPVSGQVKRWWGTLDNSPYGFPPRRLSNYIGQFVTDDPDIGPWSLATAPLYALAGTIAGGDAGQRRLALAVIGLSLTAAAAALTWNRRKRLTGVITDLGLVPLLLACLAQIAYYKLSGSVAQRPWYWIGEMLWLVMAGGLLLDSAGRTLAGTSLPPAPRRAIVGLAAALITAILIRPHLPRLEGIFSPEIARETSFYRLRSDWIEAHTPRDAMIGMTGTGSAAYFTEGRRFANLDGLISSYAYFQSLRSGEAAAYLSDLGLDYVFGNRYIITESDPYGELFAGRLVEKGVYRSGERRLVLWQFLHQAAPARLLKQDPRLEP